MEQQAILSFWAFHFILDGDGKNYEENLEKIKRKVSKIHNQDLTIWLEDRKVFLPTTNLRKVPIIIPT